MNLLSGVEQDFHRPQKSPGGYEWWHFDGTDDLSGYSFVIQFHAGNLFSPYYQDSLKTYWKKTKSPLIAPSPNPEPPNPLDYCGVSFRLFHKGNIVVESLQEFSQRSLKASDKYGAVLLGPNRFNWDPRGDPPSYVLTAQAPLPGGKTTIRARLFFTPLLNYPLTLPPQAPSTHSWVLAAPLCHVEGRLEWVNGEGDTKKEVAFVGKGYHDHHFGSVPLDRFIKAWHWGRAFLEEETIVYSLRVPLEENEKPESLVLILGSTEARISPKRLGPSKRSRNIFGVPYYEKLDYQNDEKLYVHHRQIMGNGPVLIVFKDYVLWEKLLGRGDRTRMFKGEGLSHYLYTPRLSSRFFFPMMKGKSLTVKPSEDASLPPPSDDISTTRPL